MSGSYASANLGRRGGYATSPKIRDNVARERPATFRQTEAVRPQVGTPRTRKGPSQMPVSTANPANLQQIEEAAKSGQGRRTSLPGRARAAIARASGAGGAASCGRKASPTGKAASREGTSATADMGKNLLGLDFALLAQRAAPSSKNRLEEILQQLSDEISKIALQFDDGTIPTQQVLANWQSDEGEGSAETASAATTVPMHQSASQSIETRIVERLCDKVAGMHSALQYRDLQPAFRDDPSSWEDAAFGLQKVDAHRLSQLEDLISSLQAKVETLPHYEVAEAQSVRNDRLRVEATELQQQKDALQAEVLQLQMQKQALSAQSASGARLCGVPASACTSAPAAPSVPAGREVKGQAGNVLIPQLRLGQLTDVAASISPPQSGRADNQAKTLTLPVGCSCTISSPRGRVPGSCSARAPPHASIAPSAAVRLAGSPPPARWANPPVVQSPPCVSCVLHQSHRAMTPSQAIAAGPDMRDFRWTYQPVHQMQHGMQVRLH